MKSWKILISILPVLTFFSSCMEDGQSPRMDNDSAYFLLLEEAGSGSCFIKGFSFEGNTVLSFSSGHEIEVDDFKVNNCSTTGPLGTSVDPGTGCWTIGDKKTSIRFTPDLPVSECIPVYSFFTADNFSMILSNGERIDIFSDESFPLLSFSIPRRSNPSLTEDLKFTIDGCSVTGKTDKLMNGYKFRPSFSFKGEAVLVDDEEQTSEVSVQDFSKPIIYTVIRHDGTAAEYEVSLKHIPRFPTIRIKTENLAQIKDKVNYVRGNVTFEDYDHLYSDVSELTLQMGIRGRGNSTWSEPKKPYKIKLDEKSKVFGIHKDNEWDLLANYLDKSLVRNLTAMELSRICGLSWTPKMVSAEVYLNGGYLGLYTLSEHKEVSGHKVNIEVVTDQDNSGTALTGGYYLEIDCNLDGPHAFHTGVGIPIVFSDPENPTSAQEKYIKNLLAEFERVLYSKDFANPETGYANYIDVKSFINYFIIAELSKNIDGNLRKSSFLTKDRGGKFEFYHIWDYDLAFGNCNYISSTFPGASNGTDGWFVRDYIEYGKSDGWYGRLFQDPAFIGALKERWNEVRGALYTIPDFIDDTVEALWDTPEHNFSRWRILGVRLWPNIIYPDSYQEEVSYLKDYYSKRLNWMDKAINAL